MAKLEDLKEIAKGINRNKVKNIHVIGNSNQSPTIFDEFYQALLDDKFDTDEKYAQYFYNDTPKNKAYYKLKDRLYDRLINTIFFVDINEPNLLKIQKSYYKCYKNLNAIKILIGKNIRNPAVTLSKRIIKESLIYGFTNITIEICIYLKSHYSTIEINKKEFKKYRGILKEHIKIYKKEIKSQDQMATLLLHHDKRVVLDIQNKNKFKKHFQKSKKWLFKYYSYKLYICNFLYIFLYLELNCSWEKLIKESNRFFKYVENRPNLLSPQFEVMVLSRKIIGLVMLKKYQIANETIQYSQNKIPAGTHNWFFIQDWKIRLHYQAQNFDKIEPILEDIYVSFSDGAIFKRWIESFRLHNAFIHYLKLIGKIRLSKEKKTFRLQKFLNEVPNHSKDKKGSNVTILILQILFLLEDRKYDTIIDRSESLKVYTQRYLKGDGTYRSNCFIKMLLCLPGANFEREKVELKARKYLDRLHAMPLEKAKQSAELEIIPYEMLWEFVLESLDRQKK